MRLAGPSKSEIFNPEGHPVVNHLREQISVERKSKFANTHARSAGIFGVREEKLKVAN